jgi:hypothetical protein
MGSIGDAYDDSVAEALFSSPQRELLHGPIDDEAANAA